MDSIWELEKKIEQVLNKNIKEVPWEGTEVKYDSLKEDIFNLIIETPQLFIQNIKQQKQYEKLI